MEWSRETILHFISLVKQRPAIWDFQSPEHKSKRKRFEAVEEIALLMGVTPKEVSTKWIILRNQYSREKRKIMESEGEYTTKWYAYQEMNTLMGRNKRHIRSFWTQESKSESEDTSSSPPPPENRPSVSGAEAAQNLDTIAQNTLSMYNQAIKTLKAIRENNDNTKDELTNYGLYIAAHLRKFSPPLQSRAKYEINKILYALDLESMGEYSATIPCVDDTDEIAASKDCKFDPLQSQKE